MGIRYEAEPLEKVPTAYALSARCPPEQLTMTFFENCTNLHQNAIGP